VAALARAGIGLPSGSSRQPSGWDFGRPLAIALPHRRFNAARSSIPRLAARTSSDSPRYRGGRARSACSKSSASISGCSPTTMADSASDGEYVGHEIRAIKHGPPSCDDVRAYLSRPAARRRQFRRALLIRLRSRVKEAVAATAPPCGQDLLSRRHPAGPDKVTFLSMDGEAGRVVPAASVCRPSATCRRSAEFARSGLSVARACVG